MNKSTLTLGALVPLAFLAGYYLTSSGPAAPVYTAEVSYSGGTAASGNAISKLLVCYDSDTTGGADSAIIPLTMFDFSATPSGIDIEMTGGTFYRAA